MRIRLLRNFGDEVIAAQNPARGIQEHQIRSAVSKRERRQRLQREREARLGEDCPRSAARESQAEETVSPYAPRIAITLQRAGSVGSTR